MSLRSPIGSRPALRVLSVVAVAAAAAAGSALAAEGDLDPSFSGDGKLALNLPGAEADALAVDGQGRTLVGGYIDPAGADQYDTAVARLTPGGALDTTWSGDGIVSFDAGGIGAQDAANALALDSQGRVVVAGFAHDPLDSRLMVARLTSVGALDASFGQGDGIRFDDFDANDPDVLNALAIDGADRPVAAGNTGDTVTSSDWIVARYTAAGAPDGGFGGGDGFDTLNVINLASDDFADGVGLDSQGRVLVAGRTKLDASASSFTNFAAGRWTSAGQLDTAFSGAGLDPTPGRNIIDMTGAGEFDAGFDLAVMPGDMALVVGDSETGAGPEQAALLRLTSAGEPDPTFSGDGKAFLSFLPDDADVHAVALDGLGRIVIGGTANTLTDNLFMAARLLPTGAPDGSFSGDGKTTTVVASPDDFGQEVAVDPRTGRVVVAGLSVPGADLDWALARYEGVPRCAGKVPTIAGTAGNDVLRGTKKRDLIWAGPGNDVLRGLGRADVLCGGTGNDRLLGGRGNDRLLGGKGRDRLIGGKGRDRLRGGPGRDFQRQ
jgi:uncharacterized delta-60 repeat protein